MLRRVKMVLPLVFAFLLTLLPFLLLEFTQSQRLQVQKERELYLWEQQANNYLQLFINLWSYELQLKRRLQVFRQRQSDSILRASDPEKAFARELKKRLPGKWQPEIVYAGSFNRKSHNFKLFSGEFFNSTSRAVFSKILAALAKEEEFTEAEIKTVNRFTQIAFGEDITIDFLKLSRRGKFNGGRFQGINVYFSWDFIENEQERIVYLCFFDMERVEPEYAIRSVQSILARQFPQVISALIPLEEANSSVKPIFEDRLSTAQIALIKDISAGRPIGQVGKDNSEKTRVDRAKILPVGLRRNLKNEHIIREFVDYIIPYEILLIMNQPSRQKTSGDNLLFFIRLGFFAIWILVFVKVMINGRPLGLSIANWLTLIFMVIGVLPLLVLYIAGSFHMESSAFRQEQQSLREIIRQFEDADISGEAILSEYREFCRELEMKPFWQKAMQTRDWDIWFEEVKKLPPLFEKAGLKFSACYIFPPPIARDPNDPKKRMKHIHHSFYQENSERDEALARFYHTWVDKAYYKIAPETTGGKDFDMPFFAGEEGDEILRLFMGNRADSDLVDMGDQKQFFYQNYILLDGKLRNWFFLRANIGRSYEKYLSERVSDWIKVYSSMHFALSRIAYPQSEMLLPQRGTDDKYLGVILKNAGEMIELAAATKARLFKQTDHQITIVYPCRKTGNFVLTAVMDFRNLHTRVYFQEMKLAIILVFLAIPVFFVSRFIAAYLVLPLKQIEAGLKRVAHDDFSALIKLNRQDEIGELSDAFDKMVDGIIERQNLGRFVSAGLDHKIAQETMLSEEKLEKSFAVVLCSDIRSFTTLSESHAVREIVAMLNEHLTEMSEVITRNGGLIEQFIGDAVLAVFVGGSEIEAANKAVTAGVEMTRAHKRLLQKRKKAGLFPYYMGVGIEAGKVISGVIRTGEKSEYVLIGQCRTQAELLEGKSKLGSASHIICSTQVKRLTENFSYQLLSDKQNWEIVIPGGSK